MVSSQGTFCGYVWRLLSAVQALGAGGRHSMYVGQGLNIKNRVTLPKLIEFQPGCRRLIYRLIENSELHVNQ